MYFSKILIGAFFVALFASTATSFYEDSFVTPIILAAEVYEVPEVGASDEAEAWGPNDGAERSMFTLSANFLISFGFSVLLICAMALKGGTKLKHGILWGLAGYGCFFVAPALGLAPEPPGMEAAQLEHRQAWWWITVSLATPALWMISFEKLPYKVTGLVLLTIPHIYGAPSPEKHGFTHPNPQAVEALAGLWHAFILQTAIANGLLWILIGTLSAFLITKYIEPISTQP